jgi:hypothetical protein
LAERCKRCRDYAPPGRRTIPIEPSLRATGAAHGVVKGPRSPRAAVTVPCGGPRCKGWDGAVGLGGDLGVVRGRPGRGRRGLNARCRGVGERCAVRTNRRIGDGSCWALGFMMPEPEGRAR